jgi:hypothetical protein
MDVIISLNWASAYNSVRGVMVHLGKAWRAQKFEMVELNISAAGWNDALRDLLNSRRVAFVVSVNGIGLNIQMNGENLWAKLKLPVYALQGDHPVYYAALHRTQPATVTMGYIFRDHALYQASDVKAANIVTTIDYGVPDLPVLPISEILAAGRPRIVFPKTGNSPEALAGMWRRAPVFEAILHDVMDELALTKKGNIFVGDIHPLVHKIANAHRIDLQPFDLLSRFLIAQIDDYSRRLKSTAIATALLPFEVDVFGGAWEHIDTSNARARFHGPSDYTVVESSLSGATASLNMHPNIDLGAHERFFLSLGAGSMPLTDRNGYIEQVFPELLPYSFDFTQGSITAALEKTLQNPKAALELARATRSRARAHANDAKGLSMEATAAKIAGMMSSSGFLFADQRPEQNFFVP